MVNLFLPVQNQYIYVHFVLNGVFFHSISLIMAKNIRTKGVVVKLSAPSSRKMFTKTDALAGASYGKVLLCFCLKREVAKLDAASGSAIDFVIRHFFSIKKLILSFAH